MTHDTAKAKAEAAINYPACQHCQTSTRPKHRIHPKQTNKHTGQKDRDACGNWEKEAGQNVRPESASFDTTHNKKKRKNKKDENKGKNMPTVYL